MEQDIPFDQAEIQPVFRAVRKASPWPLFVLGFALAALGCVPARASPAETPDSLDQPRLDLETGMLWRFTGSATPLDYVIEPTLLSLVDPAIFHLRLCGGDLVLRSRYSLIWEPIIKGPEHHYYGASASGLLEWWNRQRTECLFFTSGGGLGWLDAVGQQVAGAQGQEFNFTWLAYGGARLRFGRRWTASLGLYYQHLSNGHFNKVDPGINALGPMLNTGWQF